MSLTCHLLMRRSRNLLNLKICMNAVTKNYVTITPLRLLSAQTSFHSLVVSDCNFHNTSFRSYSSQQNRDSAEKLSLKLEATAKNNLSQRSRLKQAVRDYGATIVVFHVSISLASLGICYAAISTGVDAVSFLTFLGFSESVVSSKVAIGGSTFVIAYAVHKLFAPLRIAITLSVAPFIVRYLRKIRWIKPPKPKI